MMYVPVREDDALTFVAAEPTAAKAIAVAAGRDALTPAGLAEFFIDGAFLDLEDLIADNETGSEIRRYLDVDADNVMFGDFAGAWDDVMALLGKTPEDLKAFNRAFDEAIKNRRPA